MKKFIFSAMIIASVVSCTQRDTDAGVESNEIRLSSGMDDQISGKASKAAFGGASAVNSLQILRLDNSVSTPIPKNFTDAKLVEANRATDGNTTWSNPQFYRSTQEHVFFASYYPSGTISADKVATIAIDGKTDIMTAPAVYAGNTASPINAQLKYRHELAQIEVICKVATGEVENQTISRWGNIKSIKMKSTKPSMDYNWASQRIAPSGSDAYISFWDEDYTNEFVEQPIGGLSATKAIAFGMFAPSTSQLFTLEMQFDGAAIISTNNGIRSAVVDLGAGNKLERGKKHVITCTFRANQSNPIAVTTSIEEWTVGATGTGEFN